MKQAIAYGWIDDGGKLTLPAAARKRFAASLKDLGKCDVQLTVKKKGKRSTLQNAYYWSCIVTEIRMEFERLGNRMDNELVHEFLKANFNKQYVHGDGGEVIAEYGGSTTEFNKDQMSEYINRIIEWAADKLGLVIPEANSQTALFEREEAA